jgi:hypothetical protein
MPSFNLSLQPHDYECALRFRGVQGSRGDGSLVADTNRKKGEGQNAGMEEKSGKGRGSEKGLVTSCSRLHFLSLRQTKKTQQPAGAGAAGRSRPHGW